MSDEILGYLKKKKSLGARQSLPSPELTPSTKASVAITGAQTAKGITHLFECIARSAASFWSLELGLCLAGLTSYADILLLTVTLPANLFANLRAKNTRGDKIIKKRKKNRLCEDKITTRRRN